MELFDFQREVLEKSKGMSRVAYYYDMGLGKTYIGAEKLRVLNSAINLVVCQKSKLRDWLEHFIDYYSSVFSVYDLTDKNQLERFLAFEFSGGFRAVGIINYDLLIRRHELANLRGFTLMLDESSMIQNDTSKRTKFIMRKLKPDNVILLSGTPTGGRYEKLWTQLRLLGLDCTKRQYWDRYVAYYVHTAMGFPLPVVTGYRRVDELKAIMRRLGCFFMRTDEVFNLPKQIFTAVRVDRPRDYDRFRKSGSVTIGGNTLVGDTVLSQLLYSRMLCGAYNPHKIQAFKDLVESTDDRLIVFYNFNDELRALCGAVGNRTIAIVNGEMKTLDVYESEGDSITFIQYQAGAMGLNLQMANKIVYFSPPLSSELYEQSKKRIHRIGQKNHCTYYNMVAEGSVEERIYATLALRKDYTEKLFEEKC